MKETIVRTIETAHKAGKYTIKGSRKRSSRNDCEITIQIVNSETGKIENGVIFGLSMKSDYEIVADEFKNVLTKMINDPCLIPDTGGEYQR